MIMMPLDFNDVLALSPKRGGPDGKICSYGAFSCGFR